LKIGLDIDGVILDFERTMSSYAELYDLLILKKDGVINDKEFNYLKRYNWTEDETKSFIDDYLVYATINSTSFIPLIKEMFELFKIENCQFEFITSRGSLKKETKLAVIEVFKKNGLPIDHIHWEVTDKVSKCMELGINIMIDDNPTICKELQNNKIKTLYFRDKDSEKITENEYLKEVSNVGEICRFVFNFTGLKNSTETYAKILKRS